MLKFGTDEISIVLQLSELLKNQLSPEDWVLIADNMILDRFAEKAKFETVLGKQRIETNNLQGYNHTFTYGEHSFYMACSFHDTHISMGVCIHFSASALDYYLEKSNQTIYEFLQSVQDVMYTIRVSRIDFVADYIDEMIDISSIYQNLMEKKVAVFHEYVSATTGETCYKICDLEYRGIIKESEVETIYVGSKKSATFLRIYDKKIEQIDRKGRNLKLALSCDDWIRFEAIYRYHYAHQIGEQLLKIHNDDELGNLIANSILQKYRFMHIDDGQVDIPTDFTQMLIDAITNKSFVLKSPSTRNYDLINQIMYIFKGSGTLSTMFKIKQIWGNNGIDILFDLIKECLNDFEPNADCRYWLRMNVEDYKKSHPDFEVFIGDTISPFV